MQIIIQDKKENDITLSAENYETISHVDIELTPEGGTPVAIEGVCLEDLYCAVLALCTLRDRAKRAARNS